MASAFRFVAEAAPTGWNVGWYAGDDPRDERPVKGAIAIERGSVGARACKAARDDHLGRRPSSRPFREAGREREACRVEECMLLVDTVVHHGHLHAVSPCSGQAG